MRKQLQQLLKELKTITQEDIDNNLNTFLSRDSMINTIQKRIEMILNSDEERKVRFDKTKKEQLNTSLSITKQKHLTMNKNEEIIINLPNGSVLNVSNVTLNRDKSGEFSLDRVNLDHFDCESWNQVKLDSFSWHSEGEKTWTNCRSEFAEDNKLGGRNITTLNHNTINKG
tara:strand:- start:14110 stop:14622 length:513 start_codon:yes stop_codon:yes gene_type:complete